MWLRARDYQIWYANDLVHLIYQMSHLILDDNDPNLVVGAPSCILFSSSYLERAVHIDIETFFYQG